MLSKKNDRRKSSRIPSEMTFSFHNGLEATAITREREEEIEENKNEEEIQASSQVSPACSFEEADAKTNDDAFIKKYQSIIQRNNIDFESFFPKREKPKLDAINMLFADDVIEMRSPHKIPFSQYDSNSLYHDTRDVINESNRKTTRRPRIPTRSKSLSDLVQDEKEKVPAAMNSFVFGVSDDNETSINRCRLLSNAFEATPPYYQVKTKKKTSITWEQHVLNKISNDSAQFIIKKATTNKLQTKWKRLLGQVGDEAKTKSADKKVVEDTNHVTKIVSKIKKCENEKTEDEEKEDEIDYFENIPVKPEMENYVCQDVFPNKPNKWQQWRRKPTDVAKVGKVIRGLRKWTAPPMIKAESEITLAKLSETQLFDK